MIRPRLRHSFVLLALALTAVAARAQSEFAGYRIPDHRWSTWSGNLSASGQRTKFDQPVDARFSDGRLDVQARTSLTWGGDADRSQYALSLAPSFFGTRTSAERHIGAPVRDEGTTRFREAIEALDVFTSGAIYPARLPLGLSGSALFRGQFDQRWLSQSGIVRFPPAESRSVSDENGHSYQYLSSVSMGPIVGRVRNATPVLDARILEDRLARAGSLARPLSEDGRSKLAALLAMRGRLGNAHARPERYFWREVESLLRADGALGEQGLDAYSVLRVLEGVSPGDAQRFVGSSFQVFVTPVARRDHRNAAGRTTNSLYDHDTLVVQGRSEFSSADHARLDALTVGWLAEYHRPIGLRWQVDATQQLSWNDARDVLFVLDRVATTWGISDRWRASSNWTHSVFSRDRSGSRKVGSWVLNHLAEVQYQLEDAWSLGASWTHAQEHGKQTFRRSDSFSLGVSYQFSGHFVAPGLVEPMQLTPPER